MKLKRFEALTLQGALQAVKAELGPDAVIVSTRRVHKGGGLFGLMSQPVVEMTAAIDRHKKGEPPDSQKWQAGNEAEKARTNSLETVHPHLPIKQEWNFEEQLRMATVLDPLTQQLTAVREELRQLREERANPESVIRPLQQEIEGLRVVVGEVLEDRLKSRVNGLPGNLLGEYHSLVGAGIKPQLAHDLLRSVAETLGTAGLTNTQVVRELLWERLEESISVSGSCLSSGNLQKVVMLVGPTGVGKTTTIAKLASWGTRGEKPIKTVLVTLDTYRIAAVEQLRVFAKILKIPLEVAVSPEELTTCINRHRDAGLILIDTAGRSPRDRIGREELKAITRQNLKIETHLVLAATTAEPALQDIVRRYQEVPVHRLIFTKLDETGCCGPVFNLAHYAGIPMSYLSIGQRVPEDLEFATRTRVVELLGLPKVEERPLDHELVEA